MRILFLDQCGQLAGAEHALFDIARSCREHCLVGLFRDGPFRERLEEFQIPVHVFQTADLAVRKDSSWLQGLSSIPQLLPLIGQVTSRSREFDLICANTQKAMVVGAIASALNRKPLIYWLHDIISNEHFSAMNRQIMVGLANRFATTVIPTSIASQKAFVQAGGRQELTTVIYNGFDPLRYQRSDSDRDRIRQDLGLSNCFVVGHFSRLSPWKGQHVLIEALTQSPENVVVLLVGSALFGEQAYEQQLQQQIKDLGLESRVRFLGFRSDIPPLMSACDLIAHTSTAPEPFGRVIVEAMLCGTPIIAMAAGGVLELVQDGETGWLVPPNDPSALATAICACYQQPHLIQQVAAQAQQYALQNFNVETICSQFDQVVRQLQLSCELSRGSPS